LSAFLNHLSTSMQLYYLVEIWLSVVLNVLTEIKIYVISIET